MLHLYKFFIPLLLILISGCSSTNERPEYRERSLAAIYNNAVYNLDKWQTFEEANPTAFTGMYQFWCQKT